MKRVEELGPTCNRCDAPIEEGQMVCSCGRPTKFMTFEERTRFEVQQWRAYQEKSSQAG